MIIEKTIQDGKEKITITADNRKNIVRVNGGVLICKFYMLKDDDNVSDFIEVDDGNDYGVNRNNSYPTVAEQLDLIWHAIDEGKPLDKTSDFYLKVKEIKERYPKDAD